MDLVAGRLTLFMIFTTALKSAAFAVYKFDFLKKAGKSYSLWIVMFIKTFYIFWFTIFSRFLSRRWWLQETDPAIIVHVKNLKEAYFNHLFVQLRINESTKKIKSLNLKFKGKKLSLKYSLILLSKMKRIRVLIK